MHNIHVNADAQIKSEKIKDSLNEAQLLEQNFCFYCAIYSVLHREMVITVGK